MRGIGQGCTVTTGSAGSRLQLTGAVLGRDELTATLRWHSVHAGPCSQLFSLTHYSSVTPHTPAHHNHLSLSHTCRSQRVHVQDISSGQPGKPHALTAADSQQRFADYVLDADRGRLIAVCEDHSKQGQEPTNSIAAIGGVNQQGAALPVQRLQSSLHTGPAHIRVSSAAASKHPADTVSCSDPCVHCARGCAVPVPVYLRP